VSAPATTSRRKAPLRSGRRRFDYDAAFALYIDQGHGRSYAQVARHVGVSEAAVRRVGNREGWSERLTKLEAQVAEKLEREAVRSIEQRQRQNILVANKCRDTVLDPSVELDPSVALRVLPRLAHLEQLYAGEATNRVEVAEIRPLIDAYNDAVVALEELAARVDAAAAQTVVEALDETLRAVAAAARDNREVRAA